VDSDSILSVGRGHHQLFVLEFAPHGFAPDHLVVDPPDNQSLASTWARLPASLQPIPFDALSARIAEERSAIDRQTGAWNARRFALRRATVGREGDDEKPTLHLAFGETDFATHRVVSQEWSASLRDRTDRLEERAIRQVLPGLSHSFGINLTIETADGSLVLTQRSSLTSQATGLRHISVNEGTALEDRDASGLPDPYATALRGTREQLGIDLTPHRDLVVFHSLILDVTRYEWALLGHVDLRGTDVTDATLPAQRALGLSSDDWESDRLSLVRWDAASSMELLQSDDHWVGHGYLNLLLSAVHRFPRQGEDILEQARRSLLRFPPAGAPESSADRTSGRSAPRA